MSSSANVQAHMNDFIVLRLPSPVESCSHDAIIMNAPNATRIEPTKTNVALLGSKSGHAALSGADVPLSVYVKAVVLRQDDVEHSLEPRTVVPRCCPGRRKAACQAGSSPRERGALAAGCVLNADAGERDIARERA
ncbi:hypothetical protein AcV5_002644 [Taiwanofungus camphoratus]|nr:hypothetical protein AcV5_002644 [Antrodia cinnamomea]